MSDHSTNSPPWSGNTQQSPIREDQVVQAIRFLTDSRTQSASQHEKESFLRQKGLTDAEIAAAISRTNTQSSQPPVRPIYVPPPVIEEPIIWSALKSIFGALGAMAIGIIGYHMYVETGSQKDPQSDKSDDLWKKNSNENTISDTNDRVLKLENSIESMKAEQALRHKELIIAIRELTSVLSSSPEGQRKPGGSIVLPVLSVENGISKDHHNPESNGEVTEKINLEYEVEKAIKSGTDVSLQLILSQIDKKLNKSNPRFAKFSNDLILKFCGFIEDSEYMYVPAESVGKARDLAASVIAEITRQKQSVTHNVSDPPIAPWLVPPAKPENPIVEELDA